MTLNKVVTVCPAIQSVTPVVMHIAVKIFPIKFKQLD